jgi:hypothetical protein
LCCGGGFVALICEVASEITSDGWMDGCVETLPSTLLS